MTRPEDFGDRPPLRPPVQSLAMPAFEEAYRLDNGLKIVVIPNHEVPLVTMRLGIKCGACTDPPGLQGVASLACSMVTRGTASSTADQLAEVLDVFAIELSGECDHDSASIVASCLTEQADRTMSLLAEVVKEPTFPADEFQLMAEQMRAGLIVSMMEPAYVADREFRRRLWGEHPYGRSQGPELADLERIRPVHLRTWWRDHVRPDETVLIVAGDLTLQSVRELARRYFADWQADGPTPKSDPPEVPPARDTHIWLVDRPGSVQSQIRLGHVAIDHRHERWFDAVALTQVFGGALGSRLDQAMRSEKGLTYGAQGGFEARRFAGLLKVSTFTQTTSTAETVRIAIDEIRRMQTSPATYEETKTAVSYLGGSFAARQETPMAVAADVWLLEYCGLPSDYYTRYIREVTHASADGLAAAAKQLFKPDQLVVVVVGDALQLENELAEIAPVTVVKMELPIPPRPTETG
jgi:zinc protease